MSKMTQVVESNRYDEKTGRVTNFMGGNSYKLNPLETLKIVTSSSIFGEPAYYRNGQFDDMKVKDGTFGIHRLFVDQCVLSLDEYKGKKTSEVMEYVIDNALDYDYEATLQWAIKCRTEFNMRLNPQVIMVRAALNKNRQEFTDKNPGKFAEINKQVMSRGDDVISQLTYYLFRKGSKKSIPGVLKRSWAKKLESLTPYEVAKYKNHGIGLVDTVRICHAYSLDISELMQTGAVEVNSSQKTWETLRASGMSWIEILDQIKVPHMALLRNLRGIFKEVNDSQLCQSLMYALLDGVKNGKQFPFRYMSALNAVEHDDKVNHKEIITEGLNHCLNKSCANLPMLRGKTACLSDNSGSAWGTCTSEFGTVRIAEIGNLSSVIAAVNSEDGCVYTFGDKLIKYEVKKQEGILDQAKKISDDAKGKVGQGTEGGLWTFFKKAIENKEFFDNIFIYSDQQAGHGGLYSTENDDDLKKVFSAGRGGYATYIDVVKCINAYREIVNPKVNVFCIQTAGYDNMLIPENGYRTSILYGWTGKELVYANEINNFWDEYDWKN